MVTYWERADLLALVCGVLLWVCHFLFGILGHIWYLMVSISDLCTLNYFVSYQIWVNLFFKCSAQLSYSARSLPTILV